MSCHYSFLSRDHFPQIHQTFREAFADYYVDTSHVTEKILFNRAVKNGVEFESSVGAFDGAKMIGVTLIGIGNWKNELSAFDIGTGIIPAYRGKGIAKQMFDVALPKLTKRGARRFVLEVIQDNEPAIKAYRATGFEITREFDCFELKFQNANLKTESRDGAVEIHPVGKDILTTFNEDLDWPPSWENSFASIERIPDETALYGAFTDNRCAGLLVYYPLLNWIMSLVVRKNYRRKGIAARLLSHFVDNYSNDMSAVKIINVDHSDTATLNLLEKTGFELYVRQFEMELSL